MILSLLLIFSFQMRAAIFQEDDRVDTWRASSLMQHLGRSTAALIQKNRKGIPLKELNFCSDEKFAHESIVANCSASLIAPDKVLTAAHCFDHTPCSSYNVVFDYQNDKLISKDQVYECKTLVYYRYDDFFGVDLAIIELDRPVLDRAPVKLSLDLQVGQELSMIGHPLGISQKVVESGSVTSINSNDHSFRHNLDTFSVNSGGPIFNALGEQVGVLVRGTGANHELDEKSNCQRWYKGNESDFAEANDLKTLPKKFLVNVD